MTNKKSDSESGSSGKCCSMLFIIGSALVLIAAIIIMLIPDPIQPASYELLDPPSLTGPLAPNERLKSVVKMFDSIKGPESITFLNDHLFTGTADGKILKINRSGAVSVLAKLGNCTSIMTCGRPLGMRIDPTRKFLVVADAYLGLHKIDPITGKHEKLFPFDEQLKVTFFDDFDFLPNGDIVLSEASTRFPYHELTNEALECGGNGRLLRINLKNRRYEVILDGLFFPNGVQKDLRDGGRESVLVAETSRNRILRVFVDGKRKGHVEIFNENLPGMPDNIRPTEAGDGYWAPIGFVRTQELDCHGNMLSKWPYLRLLAAKMIPPSLIEKSVHCPYVLLVKLNLNGKIVSSLHDTTASVIQASTEVTEHAGSLYFGNFDSTGIGRLDQSCKENNKCFFQNHESVNMASADIFLQRYGQSQG